MVSVPTYRKCKHCEEVFTVATVNQYSDRPRKNHLFCSQKCKDIFKHKTYDKLPEVKAKRRIRDLDLYYNKNQKKQCSMCGITENLKIHHNSYELGDIEILCRTCHRKHHFQEVEA